MPTLRSMRAVLLVGGLAASCLLFIAPVQATHPRPKGASPFRVPLVPAYNPCTAPDRRHGPPLAYPSCNPPAQSSAYLTVGTPDANGAAANAVGFFRLGVLPGDPDNIAVAVEISDVRCKPAMTTACGSANASGGPDYAGQLLADMTLRLTDHDNATAPGGGTDAATMIEIPSIVQFSCVATADPAIGASCKFVQGLCPVDGCSSIENGDRTLAALGQVRVLDGGPDGGASTADNTLFAVQGLLVP